MPGSPNRWFLPDVRFIIPKLCQLSYNRFHPFQKIIINPSKIQKLWSTHAPHILRTRETDLTIFVSKPIITLIRLKENPPSASKKEEEGRLWEDPFRLSELFDRINDPNDRQCSSSIFRFVG